MDTTPILVLLIDDDEDYFIITRDLLADVSATDYQLGWVNDFDAGCAAQARDEHDIYLLDYRLGARIGLELIQWATANGCSAPMILLTSQGDRAVDIQAMQAGAADYLIKGQIDPLQLDRAIRHALERHRIQQALQQSENNFRQLFESMAAGFALHEIIRDEAGNPSDYRFLQVNPAFEVVTGLKAKDLLGRTAREVMPNLEPHWIERYGRVATTGESIQFENFSQDLNRHYQVAAYSPKPEHFAVTIEDVTERRRAAESQTLLATAVEQSAEMIVVTDVAGVIQYVNPAFERTTGYALSEVRGETPRLLKSGLQEAAVYKQLWDTINTGLVWKGRLINKRKDGVQYTIDSTISPVRDTHGTIIRYVAVSRDITYEQAIEEQLRQVQKMDAVGRLAGGVAHDFNNMLTVISGYCGLLSLRVAANPDLLRHVEQVQKAAERAAGLTRQLLAFSRRQVLQPRVLDIHHVLHNMEGMLHRLIGEDIELQTRFTSPPPNVKADIGQIEQVIMNLVVNARDAMPTGGQVLLSTATVTRATDPFLQTEKEATAATYCRIGVCDTGVGMTDQVKAHLFEPFFTTKGPGKGVGLGLATSYGIIKQSHGHIRVSSNPGEGSTFWIYLPACPAAAAVLPSEPPGAVPRDCRGTVLIVEDEPAVRELAEVTLTEAGFHVLTAGNGLEGLQCVRAREPVDLIITDVIMPLMGGPEMVTQLRRTHPNQKVMYMSGYTADAINRCGELDPGIVFIEKPFTPAQFLQCVHEVITRRTGGGTAATIAEACLC